MSLWALWKQLSESENLILWMKSYFQIPPPTWRSPTQTTTDQRSARPTQPKIQFRTQTTTGTRTRATPTTTWTTWGPTWRSTTTRGGGNEVCGGLSKISENGRWLPFLKDWLENLKERRKKRKLSHKMIQRCCAQNYAYVFVNISSDKIIKMCNDCFHCGCVTRDITLSVSLSVTIANRAILSSLMSPWPECWSVTNKTSFENCTTSAVTWRKRVREAEFERTHALAFRVPVQKCHWPGLVTGVPHV